MGNSLSERNERPIGHRGSPPRAWTDWYRFARDELALSHTERVEYANLRYVEEQNRASLRRRSAGCQ